MHLIVSSPQPSWFEPQSTAIFAFHYAILNNYADSIAPVQCMSCSFGSNFVCIFVFGSFCLVQACLIDPVATGGLNHECMVTKTTAQPLAMSM